MVNVGFLRFQMNHLIITGHDEQSSIGCCLLWFPPQFSQAHELPPARNFQRKKVVEKKTCNQSNLNEKKTKKKRHKEIGERFFLESWKEMFWNLDLDLWNTKFAGNPYNFVYKPIIIGLINHPQVYENNGTLDSIIAHISQKSWRFCCKTSVSFTSPAERLGRGSLPLQKQLSDFARLGVGRIFDGRFLKRQFVKNLVI